jgi:hypothetical protein
MISGLDLKHKSGNEYGDRPCPNCGGTDRFWISEYQGLLRHHCRKDCSFVDRQKALQRDGVLPVERESERPKEQFSPETPYHVRKRIGLKGSSAVCDGDTVVIEIVDIRTRELRGKQYIMPDGSKKFTPKLRKEGAGTFIGEATDVVYVAEGWANAVIVHQATGKQSIFALDAGNIPKTVAILREMGRDVIVAADNDEAGIKAAKATGASWVAPMNAGNDWWDVFDTNGLNAVSEQLQSASTKPQMQLFDHVLDINLEPPKWLIEGIVPEYAVCAIVAPSYTGKSYVAVDMACAVANGIKWHDKFDVAHGNVFYIIGEGRFGVRRRVEAWHHNRGVMMDRETTNLHFSRQGLNFRDRGSIESIKADMRLVRNIKLIVIDTLARSFGGGNENAPQDMGEFINNCDELMHEFGATVLIIHHVGKDAQSGARGHSSFFGALDTSMRLKKFGSHDIQLICDKQKDAPEFEKLQFVFVTLGGADETPVLELVPTAKTSNAPRLRKNEQLAMDTFYEATNGRPLQCRLHLKDWRSIFMKRHTGDTDKGKNDAFSRARRELVSKGFLQADNDYYTFGDKATFDDKQEKCRQTKS